jgi:hypothetical protein
MISTGEVVGIGESLQEVLYKSWLAAGHRIQSAVILVCIEQESKKVDALLKQLHQKGWKIQEVSKISNLESFLRNKKIGLVINLLNSPNMILEHARHYPLRRLCAMHRIPLITSEPLTRQILQSLIRFMPL